MYCVNCGGKIEMGVIFCPKCGTKVINLPSEGLPAINNVEHTPILQQTAVQENILKFKEFKALRILSIIGFIWFPLSLFSYYGSITEGQVFSFTFIIFGYALAHSIVALVQGNRYRITLLKVMAIIGIVWYAISSFCIFGFMYEDWEISQGWAVLGLAYALAFSIVVFTQVRKK